MFSDIKCYVINLDRSPDRLNAFKSAFSTAGVEFERISGVDGNSSDIRGLFDDQKCRQEMGRSIQPGEVGCFLSHVKALEAFLNSGEEYAIVFEDDALPRHDFVQIIEALLSNMKERKEGFFAVNLGPSDFKYSSIVFPLGDGVLRCAHRFPMLATGILWSRQGANFFMENFSTVGMPYDNFLRFLFSGTHKAFSVQPGIVKSANTQSDIDERNTTSSRSKKNRSKYYFIMKQRRIFRDKLRGVIGKMLWLIRASQQ